MLLKKERDFSTAVLDTVAALVVVLDLQGRVVRFNRACEQITGYAFEEVKGKHFWDIFLLPEQIEPVKAVFGQLRSGHFPNKHENYWVTKEGNHRLIAWSNTVLLGNDGSVEHIIGTGIDVTDRRSAEKALHDILAETRKQQQETSALLYGARAVLKHKDFEGASRSIFDICKRLIGATAGYVALLSKGGEENELLFLDSGGLPCTVNPELPMPIRGLRAEAYRTQKAAYDNSFSNSEWTKFLPKGHVNMDNVLFVPLVLDGRAAGILGLANKPGGFTEHDVQVASAFGELAAVALHNSRTLNALEKSEQDFRSVVQTATDAIISIDSLGKVVFWNDAAEAIFGYALDEIKGKPITMIMPERFRKDHERGTKELVETGRSSLLGRNVEMAGLRKDGKEFPVELSLARWGQKQGTFFTGIIRDVSERKQSEEALRNAHDELEKRVEKRTAELVKANQALEAEIVDRKRAEQDAHKIKRRFQELWDNAPVAYHTLDNNGVITSVNSTEAHMLGYSKEEMIGKTIFEFILPDQRTDAKNRFQQKLREEPVPRHDSRIYVKKDGSKMYVSIDDVLEYGSQGSVVGIRTTMVDVTQRKKAEEALQKSEDQLRRLSSQLLTVQEDQRKEIARELHDSIGQSLAAVKFVAENALGQTSQCDTTASTESLKTLIRLVQQAAKEVRRIHTDLRPSLLDDLGVASTIAWFCREFATVYKDIRIDKHIEIEEYHVPESLKIVIFRILQEALNNAAKYGKANLIRVSLRKKGNTLEFAVGDNGLGFDMAEVRSSKRLKSGFGLTSMKERTELSGGTLSIQSAPGAGTTIRASWPLQND